MHSPHTCTPHTCTPHSQQYYPVIEIVVRTCRSGGIDTKVHGISVIGRVDMNEDEVAASFSFLTVEDTSKVCVHACVCVCVHACVCVCVHACVHSCQ